MNNDDLLVYESEQFGKIQVVIIDGKEYFPATECAKILGYSNPHDAIIRHCKSDGLVKHEGVSFTTNQYGETSQQVNELKYISEGNLYRLIIRSRLPEAQKFENWVLMR